MTWFRRRSEPTVAAASRGALEIRQPWLRPDSVFPGRAGGYLTIANAGAAGDRLTGASSPAADTIEVHAIRVVGAGIRMQVQPDGLAIPAGSTIALKPRGYHLLLKGVKDPLAPGSRVMATLAFESAGAIDIEMTVEAPGDVGETVLDADRHPQ